MTWFTAQSVSINNNQTIVSVVNATSDDIAIAQEAGGLIIGTNPPVEIKRTYLDGSGNKRIELRQPWPYSNQTNQAAVAFPTDADLAEATRVLRAVGSDAVTFAEALSQVLSSTAPTITIQTETSGPVTVVPYGRLNQQVQALLNTFGDFGVPLYDTDTKNQARTLLGLQPQITAQPTIDFDFTNNDYRVYEPFGLTRKTLTEAITTTRGSGASYNSPFGVAQAAANIPRIEYDPATGECLGLFCEEQRTNLLLWSEDFSNAAWTKNNITITNKTTLTDNATSAAHQILQNYVLPAVGPSTITIEAKAGTLSRIGFYINETGSTANKVIAEVNLLTGAVTGVQSIGAYTNVTASARPNGIGGWFFSITFTPNSVNVQVRLSMLDGSATANSVNYSGTGKSVEIFRIWAEAGSFPASYIKTEGSQVTRVADSHSSLIAYRKEQSTIFAQFVYKKLNKNQDIFGFLLDTNNRFGIALVGSNALDIRAVNNGVFAGNLTAPASSLSEGIVKAALCNTSTGIKLVVNGVVYSLTTSFVLSDGMTLRFGNGILGTMSSTIMKAHYYPRALSDQELIDLTRL